MSTREYVKFMTETIIHHLETPKSERKEARKRKKELKEPAGIRWFGMVPLAVSMWFRRNNM